MFCPLSCPSRTSWPRIQREILLPSDLEISCNSCGLIDYAVCHRSLVNIVRMQSFVEGLVENTSSLAVDLAQRAKKLPDAFAQHGSHRSQFCFTITWSKCVNLNRSCIFDIPTRDSLV